MLEKISVLYMVTSYTRGELIQMHCYFDIYFWFARWPRSSTKHSGRRLRENKPLVVALAVGAFHSASELFTADFPADDNLLTFLQTFSLSGVAWELSILRRQFSFSFLFVQKVIFNVELIIWHSWMFHTLKCFQNETFMGLPSLPWTCSII